jgi:hypothetical protein
VPNWTNNDILTMNVNKDILFECNPERPLHVCKEKPYQ